MDRNTQLINERYDALMFASGPDTARKAARELVRVVLGDETAQGSLEEGLRQVCRQLRPSEDPREQARFESEFLELALLDGGTRSLAA